MQNINHIYNDAKQHQKNIKEAVKLHTVCLSSSNDRHPVPKPLRLKD